MLQTIPNDDFSKQSTNSSSHPPNTHPVHFLAPVIDKSDLPPKAPLPAPDGTQSKQTDALQASRPLTGQSAHPHKIDERIDIQHSDHKASLEQSTNPLTLQQSATQLDNPPAPHKLFRTTAASPSDLSRVETGVDQNLAVGDSLVLGRQKLNRQSLDSRNRSDGPRAELVVDVPTGEDPEVITGDTRLNDGNTRLDNEQSKLKGAGIKLGVGGNEPGNEAKSLGSGDKVSGIALSKLEVGANDDLSIGAKAPDGRSVTVSACVA